MRAVYNQLSKYDYVKIRASGKDTNYMFVERFCIYHSRRDILISLDLNLFTILPSDISPTGFIHRQWHALH